MFGVILISTVSHVLTGMEKGGGHGEDSNGRANENARPKILSKVF
jgi:hypothetical protein